ncbi:MAG: hypothetical protein ACO3C1_04470 [Ilumatobacteraceae bacterium]
MNDFDDQISAALRGHAAHIEVAPAGFEEVRRRARLRRARHTGLAIVPVLVAAAYVSGAARSNRTDIGVASDGAPTGEATTVVCATGALTKVDPVSGELVAVTVPVETTIPLGGDATVVSTEQPEYPLSTTSTISPVEAAVTTSIVDETVTPTTIVTLVGSGVISVGSPTGTLVDFGIAGPQPWSDPCATLDLEGATGITQCVVVSTVDTTLALTDEVSTTSTWPGPATTTTTILISTAPGASGVTSYFSDGDTNWSCTTAATAASGDCSVILPGSDGDAVPVTTATPVDTAGGGDEPLTVVGCDPGTATSCRIVAPSTSTPETSQVAPTAPTTVAYSVGGTTYSCDTGSLDTAICGPVPTTFESTAPDVLVCTTPAEPATSTSLG